MTSRIGIAATLLALAGPGLAACPPLPSTLSVHDAVTAALCHNPALRKSAAQRDLKSAELELARASERPTVALSAGRSETRFDAPVAGLAQSNTTQYALTANWVAWDSDARGSATRGAKHAVRAAQSLASANREAVLYQVALAWLQANVARTRVTALALSEQLASELHEVTRAKREAGLVTGADVLQAESEWRQAQYRVSKAALDEERTLNALAQLLGVSESVKVSSDIAALAAAVAPNENGMAGIAETVERARTSHVVRAAGANEAAGREALIAAHAAYKPTLVLGLERQGSETNNVPRDAWVARATLTVPLYTGGARSAREDAALAALAVQQAATAEAQLNAETDGREAAQRVPRARQAWESAMLAEHAAEQAAEITVGRYAAGVGPLPDVLRSRATLESARLTRLEAYADYLGAQLELKRATDTLGAALASAPSSTSRAPQ